MSTVKSTSSVDTTPTQTPPPTPDQPDPSSRPDEADQANQAGLDASIPAKALAQSPGDRRMRMLRWVSIGIIFLSVFLIIGRVVPVKLLTGMMDGWIKSLGVWGPVIYVLIYIIASVLLIPGSAITLAGGAMFGLVMGTIIVSLASTSSAAAAFLIGRYVARDRIKMLVSGNPQFAAVDKAISEGGWKIVALLRLSPAVPFNLLNYMLGLTGIRFTTAVFTSWLAMLPGTIMYVYIGTIAGLAMGAGGDNRERSVAEWVLLGLGLAATVLVSWYITRLAKKKLKEQTDIAAPASGQSDQAPEEAGMDVNKKEDQELSRAALARPVKRGSTWVLAGLAVIMMAGAGAGFVFGNTIQDYLGNLLGAPVKVKLAEAYQRNPDGPTFDHSGFDALVAQHVDGEGWVDYPALAKDPASLDQYITSLGEAPFDQMGRDEKLALLINAYNAFTIKLILDHGQPETIMLIDGADRWDAVRWKIGPHTWSLNQIEHEQIRPKFREARIHFALVCAAVGCPPLRNEAFTARKLEKQLESQAQYVHDHANWFDYDARNNVLRMTKLYNPFWYGGDFAQIADSPLRFAARYSKPLQSALDQGKVPRIEYLPYDWTLNSASNKRPR